MKYQIGEKVYTCRVGYHEARLGEIVFYDGTLRPYFIKYIDCHSSVGAQMDHWLDRWPGLEEKLLKIQKEHGEGCLLRMV